MEGAPITTDRAIEIHARARRYVIIAQMLEGPCFLESYGSYSFRKRAGASATPSRKERASPREANPVIHGK